MSAGFHTFDLFPLNTGYNSIWFIGLYFIASLIRRTDFTLVGKQKPIALVIYLIAVVVGAITIIGYSSFITLSHSIVVFLFFKDLKIKNAKISKAICAISPLTFGIYLIHDSNEMRG